MTNQAKKYEFTGETIQHYDRTLRRIRRLKDGLVGGWIEKEESLSHRGGCFVFDNAKVWGNAWVGDEARVYGEAEVYGNALVTGEARVSDNAEVYGFAQIYGNAQIGGEAEVYGNAKVYGDALVTGEARVSDNAEVYGFAQVYGNARVCGYTIVCEDTYLNGISQSPDTLKENSTEKTDLKTIPIKIQGNPVVAVNGNNVTITLTISLGEIQ